MTEEFKPTVGEIFMVRSALITKASRSLSGDRSWSERNFMNVLISARFPNVTRACREDFATMGAMGWGNWGKKYRTTISANNKTLVKKYGL